MFDALLYFYFQVHKYFFHNVFLSFLYKAVNLPLKQYNTHQKIALDLLAFDLLHLHQANYLSIRSDLLHLKLKGHHYKSQIRQ